ncbi:hypothetical protein RPC_3344 [Rhodopseudomonas palustris BisB18]|uniref:Uncharacterized protein n=1 Tax=Rhodopseudomonas palustris (strain BisB18) TaxID=316056 RepID=Q211Q0_RHOPB
MKYPLCGPDRLSPFRTACQHSIARFRDDFAEPKAQRCVVRGCRTRRPEPRPQRMKKVIELPVRSEGGLIRYDFNGLFECSER